MKMGKALLLWRSLCYRPWISGLVVMLTALTIGLAVTVLLVSTGLQQGVARAVEPFPLLAGAKGSPYQLVLNTVFLQDVPLGNISAASLQELQQSPLVDTAIPLGFGDNYRGCPIIGSTPELFTYRVGSNPRPWLQLAAGRSFQAPFEAVLGAEAAAMSRLQAGDSFRSSHGIVQSREAKEHAQSFTVVGILQPLAAPYDRGILVSMDSLYELHAHAEQASVGEGSSAAEHGVTAVLVRPRGYQEALQLYAAYQSSAALQLIFPSQSVLRFFALLGNAERLLNGIAAAVIVMAFIVMGSVLYWSALARQREYAVLRALGAGRQTLRYLILGEGASLSLAGIVLGALAGHAAFAVLAALLAHRTAITLQFAFSWQEAALLLAAATAALLVSSLPVRRLLRRDTAENL